MRSFNAKIIHKARSGSPWSLTRFRPRSCSAPAGDRNFGAPAHRMTWGRAAKAHGAPRSCEMPGRALGAPLQACD